MKELSSSRRRPFRIFSFLAAAICVFGLAYYFRASVQEIKRVEKDSAETSAFIRIIPSRTFATTPAEDSSPVSLAFRSSDSARTVNLPTAKDESVLDTLLTPFLNEARRRRAEFARTDPEYLNRIDRELNIGRINFLLFGYGETHEPPLTEKALIGSQTILSYDLQSRQVDIFSFTHDIRAPEIERELVRRGQSPGAVRIDQAYNVGGFRLMRQVMEDATGLAIDFQVTFRDSVMQGLIDDVFGGLEVDVPATFDVHPFYLGGKKYDAGHFAKGLQEMNGRQVVQFIKTVPVAQGEYDKLLEHNSRKALVFDALRHALDQHYDDRGFWLRSSSFVAKEIVTGSIVYDFDPVPLLVNNIGSAPVGLQRVLSHERRGGSPLPAINRSKYIVDSEHGDGGVQWVNANAAENSITQRDIERGVYNPMDIEIPLNANPYGDLVKEYWPSVRFLVRYTLGAQDPPYNFPTE